MITSFWRRHGLYVSPLTFDTMLAEFIVDPWLTQSGTEEPCLRETWRRDDPHRRVDRQRQEADHHGRSGDRVRGAVCSGRCRDHVAAHAHSAGRTCARVNGEKLLEEIDLPLTPVLADMEMPASRSICPSLKRRRKRLEKRMARSKSRFMSWLANRSTSTPRNNFQMSSSNN